MASSTDERPVVVCIPAFNEERTIAKVILEAKRFADTVLVCDDGSTDMTYEIAQALGVRVARHQTNMGKGEALRSLIGEAKRLNPMVVVTIDGDGQHDPSDIPRVVQPILNGEADMVVGVRPMKSGIMPRKRILGNRLLTAITNVKAHQRFHDSQSGFRAYSLLAIERVSFVPAGMAVDSQTLIDAAASGLRIREVPVTTSYKGVGNRRSLATHLSEVLDYMIAKTVADRPLLYLGIPGLMAILLGVIGGLRVVDIFVRTNQIAIGTGLIAVTLIIVGSVMVATSVVMKLLQVQVRR